MRGKVSYSAWLRFRSRSISEFGSPAMSPKCMTAKDWKNTV